MLAFALAVLPAWNPPQNPRHQQGGREPWHLDENGTGSAAGMSVATAGDVAVVAWVENGGLAPEVRFALSLDAGLTYTDPQRVDGDNSGASKTVTDASILLFNQDVHLFWLDTRSGSSELYHRASRDLGLTWGAEQTLDPGGARSVEDWRAQVSFLGNRVVVLAQVSQEQWADGIVAIRSNDFGLTFLAVDVANGSAISGMDLVRDNAGPSPILTLVWLDDAGSPGVLHPFLRSSGDFGMTWGAPRSLGGSPAVAGKVSVASNRADLLVTWAGTSATTGLIESMALLSRDGGLTWNSEMEVSNASGSTQGATRPDALIHRGSLYVTWTDDRSGTSDLYLATSPDFGTSWSEQMLGSGWNPELIGLDTSQFIAILYEDLAGPRGVFSRDSGAEFTNPFSMHEDDPGPAIAVSSRFDPMNENFLVAWVQIEGTEFHALAGGFRGQKTAVGGDKVPGGRIQVLMVEFPIDQAGWQYQVLVSSALGLTPLPAGDPRSIGLLQDFLFLASVNYPRLRGVLDAEAEATTPFFTVPRALPVGTTIFFGSISFQDNPAGSGLVFGSVTDGQPVTF